MFVAAHNGARIWGGAERATVRLLAGLQGRGHRVLLYCNRSLVAERATEMGVPARLLPIGGDIALPHAARLGLRLRADRPDVLIVGTYKKLFLAALGARLAHTPRVVARIGLETDVPRAWKYRHALRSWVDLVVVTAERMRAPFVQVLGEDPRRVAVIPNAAPEPEGLLPREKARARLDLPPESPVVGAVARLATQKRLDRLLRAVARLGPNAHVVIAGDGPERAALEQLAGELGIAGRVHFLGHRTDLGPIYSAMDLMVVSSDREGMSNAMLEALAADVPVVSTPVSGAEDALHPSPDGSEPGRLLSGFSADELSEVLAELLAAPELLQGMRRAAGERARTEFGFETLLDRWEVALAREPIPLARPGALA